MSFALFVLALAQAEEGLPASWDDASLAEVVRTVTGASVDDATFRHHRVTYRADDPVRDRDAALKILEALLAVHGFSWTEQGGIRRTGECHVESEKVVSRLFKLRHTSARDVHAALL